MKKILFPTAYTAHSSVAFRYTQRLAQYFEASVTLVHIYESASPTLSGNASALNEDLQHFAEMQWEKEMTRLKSFASELADKQYHHIDLDFIVTDGHVTEQILDIQAENNFDLIVMGTKRHTVLDRLFGNTTYSLIDQASAPLLLVPPDAHFMNIDKILYGTTFKVGDQKTIEYLLDWCLAFGSKLDLLHVYQNEHTTDAGSKMDELLSHFHQEVSADIITAHLQKGKVNTTLEEYIQKNGIDLLAIHRRKQGFLQEITDGSLTKLLSEDINIPLLVLKS